MGDFEEKLNAILSNPEAMGQVMQLAQSLDLSSPGSAPSVSAAEPPPSSAGLGIDAEMFSRFLPLLGELQNDPCDHRLQLLEALRPFLKPERQGKVEQALRTAKLIHAGKKLLTSMGDLHV